VEDEVVPESAGIFSPNRVGNYIWTVKTYGQLSKHGFPCFLTDRLPDEGIAVTHREFLADDRMPNSSQLFVCVVADFWRHPFAQLHVVQNPRDPMLVRGSNHWNAFFLPHWPETGLIPREQGRGDAFTNVSYFGLPANLAPQLRSDRFAARMQAEGFLFRIVGRHRWNDYSDTDAVLAVRSFARLSFHKFPPTKLYNSWIAGVPALLGQESAYQAERRSEYDYFEVRDVDDVLRTLVHLRDDRLLRAAVARNSAERAAEVAPERIAEAWARFLTTVAVPAYEKWRSMDPSCHRAFRTSRRLRYACFLGAEFGRRGMRFARKRIRALH
jgi:hypothetical protein